MATETTQQNAQPVFNIQRLYLKDLSLEQPNSPAILAELEKQAPTIEIEVSLKADKVSEEIYESVVSTVVTAKLKDKVVLLIEAKQAGLFEVRNIKEEQMEPLLNIACPSIVFPYLRANLADAVTRAGFPPIHLAEINFQSLYEHRLAQQAQAKKEAPVQKPKAMEGNGATSAFTNNLKRPPLPRA
ncbi:MAG: protein translocase subunit secB [Glomeribacter sp. 1016415]|uniref:Protein-export protein SecB n=1 Tax=Mycoavidus cysteinexigens TaxID=1553431 RepID=A0A2Z6EY47_9BURK|nr:protein-export chaperone SecB [Mycoavidus cysteinexigens]MCX8566277.1 protein translocase subunit secB [Glomeribacter sp. 1016415]BBE10298.1 preprotein translocase subunit SecB [Mycoavidus cysteinexigens]GAM53331.1 protein export cytoplasm chaperone protein [bacterium endosymbiont of Mortierella elongata FMR23-6]GLR00715.1 protein-export protein SecB [Mycoavidus cysteinexigens]